MPTERGIWHAACLPKVSIALRRVPPCRQETSASVTPKGFMFLSPSGESHHADGGDKGAAIGGVVGFLSPSGESHHADLWGGCNCSATKNRFLSPSGESHHADKCGGNSKNYPGNVSIALRRVPPCRRQKSKGHRKHRKVSIALRRVPPCRQERLDVRLCICVCFYRPQASPTMPTRGKT